MSAFNYANTTLKEDGLTSTLTVDNISLLGPWSSYRTQTVPGIEAWSKMSRKHPITCKKALMENVPPLSHGHRLRPYLMAKGRIDEEDLNTFKDWVEPENRDVWRAPFQLCDYQRFFGEKGGMRDFRGIHKQQIEDYRKWKGSSFIYKNTVQAPDFRNLHIASSFTFSGHNAGMVVGSLLWPDLDNSIIKLYNCTTIIGENVWYFINKYDWNSPINILYNKIDLYSTQHTSLDDICVATPIRELCVQFMFYYYYYYIMYEVYYYVCISAGVCILCRQKMPILNLKHNLFAVILNELYYYSKLRDQDK